MAGIPRNVLLGSVLVLTVVVGSQAFGLNLASNVSNLLGGQVYNILLIGSTIGSGVFLAREWM